MANGKAHDRFNIFIGTFIVAVMFATKMDFAIILSFTAAYLFSTLILSPDIDLGPKKRAGLLRPLIYPYSMFFKHRGFSHHLILGTLSRVIYGVIVFIALSFVLYRMGYIETSGESFAQLILNFLLNYNYQLVEYKILTWFYIGMFIADASHLFLDKLTSLFKVFR